MKVSKTFRLSEEAVEVLNSQYNATQYLEKLILADEVPAPVTEGRVSYLLAQQTAEIIDALKNKTLASPKPVRGEVPNIPGMVTADMLTHERFEGAA